MKSNKVIQYIILTVFILAGSLVYSQSIKGIIISQGENKKEPLDAAIVKWINTTKGTITDEKGNFELTLVGITDKRLVVTYTGYKKDTIEVGDKDYVEIVMESDLTTSTIEVEDIKKSTYFGNMNAKSEVISSGELVKEACCDLAGCFGRNSSVEVEVTDIITDAKELKILGLEGVYTQLLVDNLPLLTGLNVKYGISSIPGTAIDKIIVFKGSNTVLQGYESISGIMNVLIKDYGNSDRLLVNGFVNQALEKQFNLNFSNSITKKWNNILSFHSVQKSNVMDDNGDGFMDNPLITRYVLYNKWNFNDKKSKTEFNIAGRYWNEKRIGGQSTSGNHGQNFTHPPYEQTVKINSFEGYSRFSRQFTETSGMKGYLNSSYYDQGSFYGLTRYDAKQTNFSAMGFYEFEVLPNSSLKTGLSYKYLKINEVINIDASDTATRKYAGTYIKKESIPGVFAENSFSFMDQKATIMTGLRLDYHNEHKLIVTPRVLLRFQPSKVVVFRASVGTGFRTMNLFGEYSNILASSRNIVIEGKLEPEKTINYGVDMLYYFGGDNFSGNFNMDFYRTDFSNKIIPDYDSNPSEVIFANLNGKAFSNVFQAELNLTLLRNVDVKLAYKYIDIKYDKGGVRYEQPLNAKHRILTTLSYAPESKSWSISAGLNWFGKQRLPSTASNPVQYRLPNESEPYTLINAQINKNFKYFEIYAGIENLLNFKQSNPIVSADDPYSPYFDTSFIWGPTKGREIYAGFRFILAK